MAQTLINLDRQAFGKIFPFGSTAAGGDALVTINKGTAAASTVVLDVKGSQIVAGNLEVTGNITWSGSLNQKDVTNLAVTDINITLNKGGSTSGAAGAGIFVEGDSAATIAKLLYDSTLTSKWKIGDGSTQAEIVTVSGAQTLTNKSITGSQVTGNISGNAANVTGTVAVANGGTGATTLTGILKGNGTGAITAASAGTDYVVPSGNITGTASNVTGTVAVANGGTGKTSATAGAILLGNGTGAFTELLGSTSGHVVTWNGTTFVVQAPSGSSAYHHAVTVSGTQDNSNKTFTIANAVSSGSEQVFLNGILLTPGSSNDYVISGTTITFQAAVQAPLATDTLRVYGVW